MKVIVLNLHGARADAFGAYGSSWVTTPHFDRLAAEGVVFDQHYLHYLEFDPRSRAHTGLWDLSMWLCERGVPTALFTEERVVGLNSRGGELSEKHWKHLTVVGERDLAVYEQPSLTDGVFQLAIDWLQQFGSHYADWFMSLELGSLLPPWSDKEYDSPPSQEASQEGDAAAPQGPGDAAPRFDYAESESEEAPPERFGWRNAYAGIMGHIDDLVGQFFNLLRELGLDQEVLFAVTSSAGQPLGERGGVAARQIGLHEERVHLPLIIRFPTLRGAGRRVHHLTQPPDWQITLYELFGVTPLPPTVAAGKSLFRFADGQGGRLREYAITEGAYGENYHWETAIRTQDWHLILPRAEDNPRPVQLYRKPEDRWEMNNVAKEHQDVADHLELTLWRDGGDLTPILRDDILKRMQT